MTHPTATPKSEASRQHETATSVCGAGRAAGDGRGHRGGTVGSGQAAGGNSDGIPPKRKSKGADGSMVSSPTGQQANKRAFVVKLESICEAQPRLQRGRWKITRRDWK